VEVDNWYISGVLAFPVVGSISPDVTNMSPVERAVLVGYQRGKLISGWEAHVPKVESNAVLLVSP
jgi:hypothetical protein